MPPSDGGGGSGGDTFLVSPLNLVPVMTVNLTDPLIDTTSGGATPNGANIIFAGPGSIDGGAPLTLDAGRSGAISLGRLGSSTPVGAVTLSGASITLSSIDTSGSITITGGLTVVSIDTTRSIDDTTIALPAERELLTLQKQSLDAWSSWLLPEMTRTQVQPLVTILPFPDASDDRN